MKYRNILILALNASVTILKVINIFYNHLREYCIYCTVVSIVFKIQGDSFISLVSTICCTLHGGSDDAKFKHSMENPLRANPILNCIMRKQSGGVNRQSVIVRTTSNKLKSLSASIKKRSTELMLSIISFSESSLCLRSIF